MKEFSCTGIYMSTYRLYLILMVFLFCNSPAWSQTDADAVEYSYTRGFYSSPLELELSSTTPGGTIRYTLDGSKPTLTNGQDYAGPILIKGNAMVRAYCYAEGMVDSKMKTHSYIFPEQVIRQQNNMLQDYGYNYSTAETGKVFWTEEMDPEIVDADEYKNEILQALKDIPTMCVVMLKEDLWGENGIHWGDNLQEYGDDFERECSVEMIYPEGYKGNVFRNWQENAGIKIQGGGGRWDKGTYDHKQSFTLVFKNIYGQGKLRNEIFADAPHGRNTTAGKYDKIILRAGHNKSWGADWDRAKSVYTRDQLGRDLQILMSGFGSHGTFVHLYLNGKYWGLYNPCERPDHNFLANYLGGESENYFYAKGKDPNASSDRTGEPGQSKDRFFQAINKNYSNTSFEEMQSWVLVDQCIASFLVHGYANPGDGPQYYYGNNNSPYGPVVYIPWDIEDSFGGGSRRTGDPSVSNMLDDKRDENGFKAFWTNIDFRMRFNDLVYKHFYNDGVMTDENVIAAWDRLNDYIYGPIICESARWGDERSSNPMDRDHEWDAARIAVRNDLNGRASKFLTQLRSAGYFTSVPAPKYFVESTEVETSVLKSSGNTLLTISREGSSGEVYYTTNGRDPRTWDLTGSVSADALTVSGDITISKATMVKARTKSGSTWSPLHELIVFPNGIIPTAIPEEHATVKAERLLLYPNPVSDMLFLPVETDYAVYSVNGNLVLTGTGSEIIMRNLPDGLYLIRIDNVSYKVLKRD